MPRNLLIAATLTILAGCSQPETGSMGEGAAPTEATAAAAPATTEPAPAAPCTTPAGYQLLPAEIALTIRYHLRADRIYTNKNEQQRRRVVLEYLDGDVDATIASVEKSLVAAGFIARPRRNQPNGNIIIPFNRKGYGSITLVTSPSVGDNPSNPAAIGTVAFDFPIEAAADPIAAASN